MYPRFDTLTFITPYGLMLVIALLACWWLARRRALKAGIDASHIDLAMPLVFAVSVLGTQVLAIFSPTDVAITGAALSSHARLSVFALLVFALPALYVYARLSGLSPGLSFGTLLDLFALPVLGCLVLIRLGCFMAGCCWGDLQSPSPQLASSAGPGLAAQVFTLPWLAAENLWTAVSFPAGSFAWRQHIALGLIGPEATGSLPVHPTQLYECLLLAVLFCVLLRLQHRWGTAGSSVLVTLGSYAVLRFFIEFLRADNALVLGCLTFTQLVCIALFSGCVMVMTTLRFRASLVCFFCILEPFS